MMSIAWSTICRVVGWARDGIEMAADGKSKNELSLHEELVRRYFREVLDQGKVELVEQIFHPRCVMHRPRGTVVGIDSVQGVVERRKETFSQFETQIHDIFGSGDRLVARLSHRGVGGGIWRSRIGNYDVTGKTVSWNAIAIFRFEQQKIIEEWVTRDELAMILQFGLLEPARG
jgi:predicted ester cyclase